MAGESDQTRWVGTRKVDPAIADLQAIKENIGKGVSASNQNCSVLRDLSSLTVPANDIWVITNLAIYNETSLCDMVLNARIAGVRREVKRFNSYEPDVHGLWDGLIVLEKDDYITFRWLLGGVLDHIWGVYHGYKIGVY